MKNEQNVSPLWNEFAIDTQEIVLTEMKFLSDPDGFPFPKYALEVGFELETIIRNLLLKYCDPTVNYSSEKQEYLLERFNQFHRRDYGYHPFAIDYFIVAYDVPREQTTAHISFGKKEFMYLYSYDISFLATKKTLDAKQFELLFAFALRQCDLMKVAAFLNYHLTENFASEMKSFLTWLMQLQRKFVNVLFSEPLAKSIEEWIAENKINAVSSSQKKIKTFLTVDQLAYLFKALVDSKLISDENKNRVIELISENFSSKQETQISRASLNSKFYAPTENAIEFWEDQFDKLSKLAIRDKQKKQA